MTPRDFICTPSAWVNDAKLSGVSEAAELLFRRLASCTDKTWRFFIDPEDPAHTVRLAVFSPKGRFRAWSLQRVHRALRELTDAGLLERHDQGGRPALQVALAYQYTERRKEKPGPEGPAPPVQLALPGELGLTPMRAPPALAPRNRPPIVNNSGGIQGRAESEQKKTDPESARACEARRARPPAERPAPDSANQELCPGEEGSAPPAPDPERFARDPSAVPGCPVWGRLCTELGQSELRANGAMWLKRYRLCREALATGLKDWAGLREESRRRYESPAVYLTTAFENEKGKWRQAG